MNPTMGGNDYISQKKARVYAHIQICFMKLNIQYKMR